MFDRDDIFWLLVVSGVVALVAVLLGKYCNYLEGRYAAQMNLPEKVVDKTARAAQASDQPPQRYHAQVLAQAAVGYYVCLFFALLGFVLIAVTDDDGRGPVAAVIALVLAVVFAVESRRSRAGMLEKTRALQAERVQLIQMVSNDDARNQLISALLRGEQGADEPQPSRNGQDTAKMAAKS